MVLQHIEMSVRECCRLAHSRLQEYMLRDALKLDAVNMEALWGRTIIESPSLLDIDGPSPVVTPLKQGVGYHPIVLCIRKKKDANTFGYKTSNIECIDRR